MMVNANPISPFEEMSQDGARILSGVKLAEMNRQYDELAAACVEKPCAASNQEIVAMLDLLRMDIESMDDLRMRGEREGEWARLGRSCEKVVLELWHVYLSAPGDGGVHDKVNLAYKRAELAVDAVFASMARAIVKRDRLGCEELKRLGRCFFE